MQIYAVLGGLARPLDSLIGIPFGLCAWTTAPSKFGSAFEKDEIKTALLSHAGCSCRRALSQVPLAPRIRSSRKRADYESDSQRIVRTHFSTLLG